MEGRFFIRPAEERDAASIVAVLRNSIDPAVLDYTVYRCHGIVSFLERQLALPPFLSGSLYLIAIAQDRIVGCAEFRRLPRSLFLNYIGVLPEHRRFGLATTLLRLAVSLDSNVERVQLDVADNNHVAKEWYRRLGFVPDGTNEWWQLSPMTDSGDAPRVLVHGYPQAQACQENFGFSELQLATSRGTYTVGRLGDRWFRLTGLDVLTDPAVPRALFQMEPTRRILAIIPSGALPESLRADGRLVMRLERMSARIEHLARKLGLDTEEQTDPMRSPFVAPG